MASDNLVPIIVTGLLSAGGATFLRSAVQGWRDLRSGVRAREREAVEDLARARDEADERSRRTESDRDYWRSTAGRYYYQLARGGFTPDPETPVPPSERRQIKGGPP